MILACWTGALAAGSAQGRRPARGPAMPVSTRKEIRAAVASTIAGGVDRRHLQEVVSVAERRIGRDGGGALEEAPRSKPHTKVAFGSSGRRRRTRASGSDVVPDGPGRRVFGAVASSVKARESHGAALPWSSTARTANIQGPSVGGEIRSPGRHGLHVVGRHRCRRCSTTVHSKSAHGSSDVNSPRRVVGRGSDGPSVIVVWRQSAVVHRLARRADRGVEAKAHDVERSSRPRLSRRRTSRRRSRLRRRRSCRPRRCRRTCWALRRRPGVAPVVLPLMFSIAAACPCRRRCPAARCC